MELIFQSLEKFLGVFPIVGNTWWRQVVCHSERCQWWGESRRAE